MPPNRPAGLPRAPAGVVAVVVLALVAPLLDERGLLVPGASPSPSGAAVLRTAGAAVAVAALVALRRLTRRGSWLEVPVSLAVAGAVGATLALLTLPVSEVALDWPPPADPMALEPSPAPVPPSGVDGAGAPPVLRLPAGGRLQVQADELLLELPDGSTYPLGEAGGGAGGSALPEGGVLQLEVDTGGGVTLGDGAGSTLADLPAGGAGLDLGDVRIEDAAGGGVAEVAGGAVTDAGGGASGQLEVVPAEPDDAGRDLVAAVGGVLLGALAYYLVFLHGRLRPRRPRLLPPPEPVEIATRPDRTAADPAAAGAGVLATLEAMLADPDPRTAIVAAYARLLAALDAAGYGRLPQEAPHEHLRRVLHPLGARPGPVHDLADLFVLARFGPAPLTFAHRDAAIAALRVAAGDLRSPVPV
jgi:hypothetical protein